MARKNKKKSLFPMKAKIAFIAVGGAVLVFLVVRAVGRISESRSGGPGEPV